MGLSEDSLELGLKKIAKSMLVAASFTYMGLVGYAWSASLGTLRVLSAPGKPLLAEIDIEDLAVGEQLTLSVGFADAQAHHRAQLEYSSNVLSKLKLEIIKESNPQSAKVRISSVEVLDIPFLETLVDLSWQGGKHRQEYFFPLAKSQASTLIKPSQPLVAPINLESLVMSPIKSQRKVVATTKNSNKDATKVSSNPAAGVSYQVKQGDNLSGIARQSAKDQRSVEVMMAAIFQANQAAFINSSIHQLKTGSELSIPSHDQAAKFSATQAVEFLAKHDRHGGYYERAAVATIRQDTEDSVKQSSKAEEENSQTAKFSQSKQKDALQVSEGQKISSEDHLRLSRSAATSASVTDKNAMADELLIKDKALKEASDRIAALEKNVSDLQRLLELKNSALQTPQVDSTQPSNQAQSQKKTWYQQPIVLILGAVALLAAFIRLLSKKNKKTYNVAKILR